VALLHATGNGCATILHVVQLSAKKPDVKSVNATKPTEGARNLTMMGARNLCVNQLNATRRPNAMTTRYARKTRERWSARNLNEMSLMKMLVAWPNGRLSSATECRDALARLNSRCTHHCLLQSTKFIQW
jgi:hypothetical protein